MQIFLILLYEVDNDLVEKKRKKKKRIVIAKRREAQTSERFSIKNETRSIVK